MPIFLFFFFFCLTVFFLLDSFATADRRPPPNAADSSLKSSSANSAKRKALFADSPGTEDDVNSSRLSKGLHLWCLWPQTSRMAPDPHGQEESGPVGSIIAGHKISLNVHYDTDPEPGRSEAPGCKPAGGPPGASRRSGCGTLGVDLMAFR